MKKFDFKNTNTRLLLVNVVLIIAGLFLSDPFGLFESSYDQAPRMFKNVTKSDVVSVKIGQAGGATLELQKSDSGWTVKSSGRLTDYPAEGSKIEAALEQLTELRKYYEVTSNPAKYAEYEVDEKGLLVQLRGARSDYSFYIGKQGSSYNTSLVRLKDDKTVYSVRGNLRAAWSQDPDYFRVRQLLHLSKENLKEVQITGAAHLELTNSDKNTWQLRQGPNLVETNQPRVNRLLDDISLLEGTEFYQLPDIGIAWGNVKAVLKSNTSFNLEVRKIGPDYIARSEQNPFWQKLPEFRVKSIFPDINEIKASAKR